MIVDSHLVMSQIIYKHITYEMNFKLNRFAFAYGNVKPDLNNKDIKCSHTLVDSLDCVSRYSEELISFEYKEIKTKTNCNNKLNQFVFMA
jgi:hypothetical protein